jgi:hypothetical protein
MVSSGDTGLEHLARQRLDAQPHGRPSLETQSTRTQLGDLRRFPTETLSRLGFWVFVVLLMRVLPLLRSLPLFLLRCCLALLLRRSLLTLLLLRSLLPLLLLLSILALLFLLLPGLALLLLLGRLALLLLLSILALLLLLLPGLALLLLLVRLALLLLLSILALLFLLLPSLALLLLLVRLALLLLLSILALLFLLLPGLALLLLLVCLALLLRISLTLLLFLLRSLLIAHRLSRWGSHIPVGCKGPIDGHAGWASMVDVGKLGSIGAGGSFILHLRRHGRRMRLSQSIQFRGPRSHLDAARSAVETHANAIP